MESLATSLKTLSDGDSGFSNIVAAAGNLVGGVGSMTATTSTGNTDTNTIVSFQEKQVAGSAWLLDTWHWIV